jgi:hypothetical protein
MSISLLLWCVLSSWDISTLTFFYPKPQFDALAECFERKRAMLHAW